MLLMAVKRIKRISLSIYEYAKANNKYIKNYDKNKESIYLQYYNVDNLYDQVMLQQLPVNNFEWIKDTFQLNENFMKYYTEESNEGYFLEGDI